MAESDGSIFVLEGGVLTNTSVARPERAAHRGKAPKANEGNRIYRLGFYWLASYNPAARRAKMHRPGQSKEYLFYANMNAKVDGCLENWRDQCYVQCKLGDRGDGVFNEIMEISKVTVSNQREDLAKQVGWVWDTEGNALMLHDYNGQLVRHRPKIGRMIDVMIGDGAAGKAELWYVKPGQLAGVSHYYLGMEDDQHGITAGEAF